MINSFEVNYWGKLNDGVVVFYFRNKNKMLKFLKFLENEMKKFQVEGKVQWRRACKKYQNSRPELWKNAKEFIPDDENEVEFTEEEFKKFSRDMKKAGIKMKTVRN